MTLYTIGYRNSAFGRDALYDNTTGSRNVAIGNDSGRNQTTGDDNIYIANEGVAAEVGQIKIGNSTDHTDAFIAGIDGNVVVGSAVFVSGSGELGVAVPSLRFKQAVEDMGASSAVLRKTRLAGC